MTIPIDMGISTSVGMFYSIIAGEKLEDEESILKSRPYKIGMGAYLLETVLPILAYKTAPDWMLMYYADHKKIPRAIQAAMFLLYPLMFTFGFLLVPQLEAMREGLSRKALAGIIAFELLFIATNSRRINYVGTTEEFERGDTTPLYSHPLGRVGVVLAPVLSVPVAIWSIRKIRKPAPGSRERHPA